MAENELTALVVDRDAVRGVRLVRGRAGMTQAAAGVWPLPAPAAEQNGGPDPLTAALAAARSGLGGASAVHVALPTAQLMVKVLALPPMDAASLGDVVRLQMEKIAPFAGDDLVVGHEVLRQDEQGVRVFAAGTARQSLDALATRLADAGLKPLRLDAALLGGWRLLADAHVLQPADGRRAVLMVCGGEWDLLVLDEGVPVLARGLGVPAEPVDLARELTLTLLAAEMDFGASPLRELLVVDDDAADAAVFAALSEAAGMPPRHLRRAQLGTPGLGVARRADEAGRLDLVPDAWRAEDRASGARRRFMLAMGAAALAWLLLAAGLLLTPLVFDALERRVAAQVKAREAAYRAVSDVRTRVRLIGTYMDRSISPLELLRVVSTVQPQGIDLGTLTYRREEGIKLSGMAADSALVYAFKDALDASGLFERSVLTGPTLDVATRRHRFEIDGRFPEAKE